MKQILTSMLYIVLAMPMIWAAEAVKQTDLPAPVLETLQKELDGYRLNRIEKTERDGKTVYEILARGRQTRRLNMEIDENGKLLEKIAEIQFRMEDGRLKREKSFFTIQSLYTPAAGDFTHGPKFFVQSLSDVSYVGGNLLAFDLSGLNEQGTAFTPKADEYYQDLLDDTLYADINMLIRIFPPDSPEDSEYRENAIKTVADYFKGQNQILFWIDGPHAEALAGNFKQIAPDLITIAPGADLEMASESGQAERNAVFILDEFPNQGGHSNHFLLQNTQENRERMDAWKARPQEKEPWVPDNSNLSAEERAEGFVSLFDGETTNGWMPQSSGRQGFIAKEGSLQRTQGGGSMLTTNRFDDFILRFDYKIEHRGNSGVQVRTGRSYRASKLGFEVQIMGDHGRDPSKDTTGAIYNVLPPTENAARPADEWNSMEVQCKGSHVKVTLNGKLVQDVDFDDHLELKYRLRDGFIILTDHGADVAYKNIRIKKL